MFNYNPKPCLLEKREHKINLHQQTNKIRRGLISGTGYRNHPISLERMSYFHELKASSLSKDVQI